METKKRYSVQKILLAILWIGITVSVSVLLVAAIRKNDAVACKGVEVQILGISSEEKFADEKDVLQAVKVVCGQNPVGKATGGFNLYKIEEELQKNPWIKSAQLFFDNKAVLKIKVYERTPIARVFTAEGNSYYIDTALKMLPLTAKLSARLPVFTGFPSGSIVLTAADSILLKEVRDVSLILQKDTFCTALVDQVYINQQRQFEMVPKIGNQLIVFGNAENAEEKFEKLKLFYKNILVKAGWVKYSVINVQYKNQVVAKLRGREDIAADSVRTLQLMQQIAVNAARMAEDSARIIMQDNNSNTADSSMIEQSIQREDNTSTSNAFINDPLQPENPPVVNKPATNPLPSAKPSKVRSESIRPIPAKPKPAVVMPTVKNSAPIKPKPEVKKNIDKTKAVMTVKTDYTPIP